MVFPMCGILAAFDIGRLGSRSADRAHVVDRARLLTHRGPDWSTTESLGNGTYLCHERLAIVGPDEGTPGAPKDSKGEQPMHSESGRFSWVVNGEIYNAPELVEKHGLQCHSASDSEVVGLLFERFGPSCVSMLDGMFAFVVVDKDSGSIFAARDHMGIIPMYMARGHDGSVWFASEMKAFAKDDLIERYEEFPPGHAFERDSAGAETMRRWWSPRWITDDTYVPHARANLEAVRSTFIRNVQSHLMADVPHGVLLSGGLDSSLLSAVAVKHGMEAENRSWGRGQKLHTFSVGIEGAPDLLAARKVADHLGTNHHEFTFTPQEALDAVKEVVYYIESYEQVRASVPMYLLARKIKALGIKMVLSGEGADEMFGGYLYFHMAPNAAEFHRECVRKTSRLHKWDVLRANKATQAWGVEVRVPFLSQGFIDTAMNISPEDKVVDMSHKPDGTHPQMEKYILRKAFDTPDDPYLPDDVLWRQKEQFSDGVGYDWVDALREHAEAAVSDEMFDKRAERFPSDPPTTKEYYLLRSLFEEHFPEPCADEQIPKGKSIACSTPEAVAWRQEWIESAGDISGRAVGGVHDAADGFTMDKDAVAGKQALNHAHPSSLEGLGTTGGVAMSNGATAAAAARRINGDRPSTATAAVRRSAPARRPRLRPGNRTTSRSALSVRSLSRPVVFCL